MLLWRKDSLLRAPEGASNFLFLNCCFNCSFFIYQPNLPHAHPTSGSTGSFFYKYNYIYLFWAVLGLRCCMIFSLDAVKIGGHGGFSCCSPGALGAVVVAQALGLRRRSCGARALLPHGIWDLLDQALNPCLLHWQADCLPLSH